MFLANSRYPRLAPVDTTPSTGEPVRALKLRRLTPVAGDARTVVGGDRLDLIAHAQYGDATQFWYVADASSALDSRTLVATPGGRVDVPRS